MDFRRNLFGDGGWINGGFFVLDPAVIERIENDATVWEEEPLKGLARDGQLTGYNHEGFWQPMDTLRDRRELRLFGHPPSTLEGLVMVDSSFGLGAEFC